jgi:ABC-type glycerol-3-phosphate transport system substrate-binding protein
VEKAADAFNMLSGLVGKRDLGDASMDDFDVAAYLAKGRATMGIVWNAWAMMLMSVGGKDLECGDLPDGPAGHQPELGTWVLAVPSNADANAKERAKKFIEFATRREQILLAAALGNPPPRKSVLRTLIEKQSSGYYGEVFPTYSPLLTSSGTIECRYRRLFKAQYRSLQQARARPRSRCWRAVEQVLGEELEPFVVRNRVEQKDVERVQKEVNELLDSPRCSMPVQQAPQVGSQEILDTHDELDKECPPQNH